MADLRSYGFSCITVTTVMQENLLCEPHAVRARVSCIMGAPNHNARNSISTSPLQGAAGTVPFSSAGAGTGFVPDRGPPESDRASVAGSFSTVTEDT